MSSRLDDVSRRSLTRIGLRLGGVMLLAIAAMSSGTRPLELTLNLLTGFGAAGSLVCLTFALALREPAGRGGINHWDEALLYAAVSRLAHLVQLAHG